MMRNALVFAALCLLPAIAGAQTRLLRQPTYSNGRVAFSYLGSIWVANDDGSNVQRLTVNSARDTNPRFPPMERPSPSPPIAKATTTSTPSPPTAAGRIG